MLIKNKSKQIRAWLLAATAFLYTAFSLQAVKADDIDIYTNAVNFGTGGEPVMTFVIDTSGSMAWNMNNDNTATDVMNERMFQVQNALRDQFTSMKGTFSVGLFSYDAGDNSGNLEKDAKPLALIENPSNAGAIPPSGTHLANNNHDVAWLNGSGVRDGENTLSFPYVVIPGGRSSLGDEVNGFWQNSGGQNSNPDSGSYNFAGAVAGNKVVKYYATSNNTQTFDLVRQGNGSSPDPYLYIMNSAGTVLVASNNNISNPVATCPNGWQLNNGQCQREVAVNCTTSEWGGQDCDYEWQYQAPTLSGGDINSRISINLVNGNEYIIVAGTNVPGQSGNFTLSLDKSSRGYFFQDQPGSSNAQNVGFRFNQVAVPKGATITSAYIRMRAQSNASSHSLDVRVDQSLAPAPLQGTNVDTGRSWFVQPSKLLSSMNTGDYMSLDVSSLLNAKLNQAGWCGGEDLVFMIEGKTPPLVVWPLIVPSPFVMQADESNVYAPRLIVNWAHNGSGACYTKTVDIKTGAIGDDVRQATNGVISRQEKELEMGKGNKAGLRFAYVGLPNALNAQGNSIGLEVTDARLRFTAASNGNPGTIFIRAIQAGLAPPFTSDTNDLDDRDLGATISWNINNWQSGNEYTSPNLKDIIQPLLEREDWEYQGTIGFIVSASSADSTEFYTFEDNNGNGVSRSGGNLYNWNNRATRAPRLTITASANYPFESADAYRKVLWDELMSNSFIPTGGTPIVGSYVEAAEYMLGQGSYDSPLDIVGTCQSNTLILLTDGDDTNWSSGRASAVQAITGKSCNEKWACGYDLAEALKEGVQWYDTTTQAGDDGTRAIKTYTIGYGPIATNTTAKQRLTNIANYGDGQFYEAKDSTLLAKAFESIIGSISDSGSSLSVPGVSVSAFNRFTVLDEVYYSLFKPSTRRNWAGNAKRYSLRGDIRDVKGNPAINGDSTYFEDESRSWWSPLDDGPVVYVGGAAGHITPVGRSLFTYKGPNGAGLGTTSGPMSERGLDLRTNGIDLIANGAALTNTDLGMEFLSDLPPAQVPARKQKITEWVQGGTPDYPRAEMGAPLHSSPVLVSYQKVAGDAVSTIFVSTNEGYLHAIDSGEPTKGNAAADQDNRGGKEVFAFIPKETLRMAAALEENAVVDLNDPNHEHAYGLDASWVYWREDGSDGAINGSDHVYLYGGMRRGGSMIYGLNVSDTYYGGDNEPKLLFAIGNSVIDGPTPVTGTPAGDVANFNNIGQTWSDVRVRSINWKGSVRTVLFFGGGYDEQHDSVNFEGTNELGSQVYMVDAATGELLWAKSTKSSIAASVRPFDRTGDNLIDGLYAVDLQGRILRFDLNGTNSDFSMYEIADLGGTSTNNRKFYAEPGISLLQNYKTGKIDIMIAVSSGYRANPLDKTVQEQFFMVFDRGAYTTDPVTGNATVPSGVIKTSDLAVVDLAGSEEGLSRDPENVNGIYQIKGWTYAFEKPIGEKGTGAPLIFNGLIFFTTYTHKESGSTTCTPILGSSRLYIMDIAGKGRAELFGGDDGSPFIDDLTAGLSSGVQLLETVNPDTGLSEVALVVDKSVVKLGGDDAPPGSEKYEKYRCEVVDCEGRDLDRATWVTKSMGADEGRLE